MTETAKYRVVQKSFMYGHTLEPGSEVEYDGEPGDNLEPLNDAAHAAMEKWYDKDYPEISPFDNKPTGKMVKLNSFKRPGKIAEAAEPPTFAVTSSAPKDMGHTVPTLAEALAGRDAKEQTRPPPAPTGAVPQPGGEGLKVTAAAPPPAKA